MFKIAKSLFAIVAVATIAAGSTSAYFSSTATITGNTFSTGTLDIRVNGEPSVVGATFSPMAPDQIGTSPVYGINNYGAPWFGGPSNLEAKQLLLSIANQDDSGSGLWEKVMIKVEVGRMSGAMQYTVYEGNINTMGTLDLLNGWWSGLTPGSTEDMRYKVWLPEDSTDQSTLMGSALTWDFNVEGRTN
jgi:predicted ribosomally synthesized peptide with SipW-like signal peptide